MQCRGEALGPGDRYLKIVEWSDEDGRYVGTCPGLMLGGIHGPVEAKVYKELCQAVDEWIEIQKEDGEPLPEPTAGREYSGRFVLRVGKELHKALAVDALRKGRSLNSYCVEVLRRRRVRDGRDSGSCPRRTRRAASPKRATAPGSPRPSRPGT